MSHNRLFSKFNSRFLTWLLALNLCFNSTLIQSSFAAEPILLQGHAEVVYDAMFLPDGRSLVTASFDQTLKLWDIGTKTPVRTMEGHTGIVLTVDVSKDGTTIASGASDNTIKLWDVPKNDPVKTLAAHTAAGSAIAVSLDGLSFATGDETGVVRIWTVADGKQAFEVKLTAGVTTLAWRRDNKQVAAGLANGSIVIVNPADGKIAGELGAHVGAVTGLQFSSNNTQLYSTGADGMAKRWPTTVVPVIEGFKEAKAVNSMTLHPSGTFVVTATANGVHVWNRADGKYLRSLEGVTGDVAAASYSTNGAQVAIGGADKIVRTFDPNSAKLVKAFPALPGKVTAVAITPNLQTVIGADDTGAIKLFKAADATEDKALAGAVGAIHAMTLTSNGTQLIAGGDDKTVRIWTLADGKEIRKVVFKHKIRALSLSSNNTLLAVGLENGSIPLLTVANGTQTGELIGHSRMITGLSFNTTQTQLVSSAKDGCRLWDLKSSKTGQLFPGHTGSVTAVQFQRDNKTVVTSGIDGKIRIAQMAIQMLHVADEKRVNSLSLASNSASYATAGEDGIVKVWTASNGAPIRSFTGFEGPALSVALSADNRQIAAGGKDGTVRTWTVANAAPIFRLPLGSPALHVQYSPDSKKLVAALENKSIQCFDPTPLNPQPAEPPSRDAAQQLSGHADQINGISWAPDNRTLRSIGKDKTVREWAVAAAGFTASLTGHSSQVYSVAFSPDGKWIASGSNDKTIRIWDVASKKALKSLPTQTAAVYGVAFSPDGKQLATAGADRTVRLFDIEKGSELMKFTGPEYALYSVAFSQDGNQIASAGMGVGQQRAVYLWNKNKPEPAKVLKEHKDDVYRVQFNSKGTRLLSLGYSGSLKIWDLQAGKVVYEEAIGAVSYSARFSADGKQLVTSSNDRTARLWNVPANAQ
jgi:WD40 repeat protein